MTFWVLQIMGGKKRCLLFLGISLYHTYYVLLHLLRSIVNSLVQP
jgi:hypothetical protein